MNKKTFEKFLNYDLVKIEYKCEECENIVYRTLFKNDIDLIIKDNANYEPIVCGICDDETMIINSVMSEKEFYDKNPDFMIGD